MDSLEGTRAQLFAVIDGAMETGARAHRDRESGQSGLFAMLVAEQPKAGHTLPNVKDWTGSEKLTAEKEMLGFYITGHPLDQYMDKVRELATHSTGQLEGLAKNTEVALCGILTGVARRRSKEGKLWASLQIEDLEGAVEAMVFSTQYERLLSSLVEDQAVLVRGLVLPEENAPPKISVQDIVPLEVARIRLPSLISIKVPMNGSGDSAPKSPAFAGPKRWRFWPVEAARTSCLIPQRLYRPTRAGIASSSRDIPSVRIRSIIYSACSPIFRSCTATAPSARITPSSPAWPGSTASR